MLTLILTSPLPSPFADGEGDEVSGVRRPVQVRVHEIEAQLRGHPAPSSPRDHPIITVSPPYHHLIITSSLPRNHPIITPSSTHHQVNPRHPMVVELNSRVKDGEADETTKVSREMAAEIKREIARDCGRDRARWTAEIDGRDRRPRSTAVCGG